MFWMKNVAKWCLEIFDLRFSNFDSESIAPVVENVTSGAGLSDV